MNMYPAYQALDTLQFPTASVGLRAYVESGFSTIEIRSSFSRDGASPKSVFVDIDVARQMLEDLTKILESCQFQEAVRT